MQKLSQEQVDVLSVAAHSLDIGAATIRVADFVTESLTLGPFEREEYFEKPEGIAEAVGYLTAEREHYLRDEGRIPTYVAYKALDNAYYISGLCTFLRSATLPDPLL